MAKLALGGTLIGYLPDAAAGDFVAADGTRRTEASLRAPAAATGQEVTYTLRAAGLRSRIDLGLQAVEVT